MLRSTGRGASVGGVIGGFAGFVGGLSIDVWGLGPSGEIVLVCVLVLGLAGLFIGAWIGAFSYAWRRRHG
jgi:hypothetical protein